MQLALAQFRPGLTQGKNSARKRKGRVVLRFLLFDRKRQVMWVDRQPRFGRAKAAPRRLRIPRQRRAATIAAFVFGPECLAEWVLQALERHVRLGQAQLLTL